MLLNSDDERSRIANPFAMPTRAPRCAGLRTQAKQPERPLLTFGEVTGAVPALATNRWGVHPRTCRRTLVPQPLRAERRNLSPQTVCGVSSVCAPRRSRSPCHLPQLPSPTSHPGTASTRSRSWLAQSPGPAWLSVSPRASTPRPTDSDQAVRAENVSPQLSAAIRRAILAGPRGLVQQICTRVVGPAL